MTEYSSSACAIDVRRRTAVRQMTHSCASNCRICIAHHDSCMHRLMQKFLIECTYHVALLSCVASYSKQQESSQIQRIKMSTAEPVNTNFSVMLKLTCYVCFMVLINIFRFGFMLFWTCDFMTYWPLHSAVNLGPYKYFLYFIIDYHQLTQLMIMNYKI